MKTEPTRLCRLFCMTRVKTVIKYILAIIVFPFSLKGQCPGGYTSATVNWDNLEFLHNRGGYYGGSNPVTSLPWVSSTMWQTQKFAIGTNRMTINTSIPVGVSGSLYGDLTTHTGETGAYGTGADISFVKTGTAASTITLTFLTEVQNLKFSVFDIDQEITFAPTATNTAGAAVSITLTKPAGASSAIPLNGNAAATTVSGNTPVANWATGGGSGTAYATTSNNGTVNVDIAGPVKTVVLTFSNDGNTNDFWLSDISACVADPGFPSNYFATYAAPFTGQPSYFLSNPQNLHVYMINASNGEAHYVFSDPGTGGTKLNSMAYDPVNKWLYYTMDNSAQAPVNKSIKKYDFNTETISTVIADIGTLGIPTFIQGIEFSGAAFYNGSLYLGIEECDGSTFGNNAESVVWKIDFDGSGTPTEATQVFATLGDNGAGTVMHDWGDLIVKDGLVISHATSGGATNNQYIHYNMQTGAATTYAGNAEAAGQIGHTTDGSIYRIKNNIAIYNNDGTIGSTTAISSTSCSIAWTGNAGDASDPFRPQCDFGDAPASYDPIALSPAVHAHACNNSTLRLGTSWDREWTKNTSADATGDNSDEDGIGTVTIMNSDGVPYDHTQPVSVFNNTGSNATLCGWLDYDADGVFEASEGVMVVVPSSASQQTISLIWNNLTVSNGTPNTFLRVRLVSGTGTLTTSNPTGWYSDGEVEDYPVVSSFSVLSSRPISISTKLTATEQVAINWNAVTDPAVRGFTVQRSNDNLKWTDIGYAHAQPDNSSYRFTDCEPPQGNSWFRVKEISTNGNIRFSNISHIIFTKPKSFKVFPNPVSSAAKIQFASRKKINAFIRIRNMSGAIQLVQEWLLHPGINEIPLNVINLSPGTYLAELEADGKIMVKKMVKLQ